MKLCQAIRYGSYTLGMGHTLDVTKLEQVFEGLRNAVPGKLTAWEMDRLEEWEALWERGVKLSERQLEILEQMWMKV